ncbi:alpha/beta hydrolase [Pseudonocardia sp. KRD-184]|uniref:Alpha/beta hydrolase n=1 Tax=Pseudonocardia oceani TaxID=2792013 RepID=A0ABS6UHQ6_9PSEU|nr:alpha/beta hydrolase [Pseudonocardia oceani]MBW0088087.1 alpha/beta hydrolase [Pseudonocardia oceani]MBW0094720.1 alpha/beta hydrolase [Pseudonocardia oceani]MBW0107318.1 alpha/beta hydrolase [Pseudonocardia oceani]MBW0120392.1 alpha/beta hydrolase [Pseudonocardia oceani]MBW0131354.1 alpha/beta hydrolase [Pseudonocardia oceani]
MTTTERLGAGRYLDAGARPDATRTSLHELTTADGATVRGVLATVPGATTVVCLMHPRQDLTHHPLVPVLLQAGVAVWTQHTRSVNNDLVLVHEQALLDVAAGLVLLRERFASVVTLGHSGGGPLYAFYLEQAGLPPADRIATTPGGRPTGLADAVLPGVDGVVFLAPHPGQGRLLLGCIDPSVADEADPLSVVPGLDPYDPANGFAEPPRSSSYDAAFLDRYRAAQRARVARIDAVARLHLARAAEARATAKRTGSAADRRRALAPRIMVVPRTDADPRTVDLSIDPSERPYGSLFGRRPDLINYGQVGFGRVTTPEAWLSTWSGLSSHADFVRCAPGVTAPTLFLELTGDQAAFPADSRRMVDALGAADLTHRTVRGLHFGAAIAEGEPTGNALAGQEIAAWLGERFATVPPG